MISIIIPVYNVGKKLDVMLQSVLRQNYRDWELILIDDGSTDETAEICDRACQIDSRIRCIHQDNKGVSAARNRGMAEAQGEYIAFLDGDDDIDQNYLKELYSACQNADIAVCDVAIEKDGMERYRFTHENSVLSGTEGMNLLLERREINSSSNAKLFKRTIVADLQFPTLKAYEDILFVLKAFAMADRISVTNRTTYHYFQNDAGTMGKFVSNPSKDIILATDYLMRYITGKTDLTPACCYVTVSHLFQYAMPVLIKNHYVSSNFIEETQKIYKKYMKTILQCSAMPWKEKIVFFCFAHGWVVGKGMKVKRIRGYI